jgi:hypothetical protein
MVMYLSYICVQLLLCERDCRKAEDGSCYFGGWARMAHPIVNFNVVEVSTSSISKMVVVTLVGGLIWVIQ